MKIEVTGHIEISGFPADAPFSFDVYPDSFVIKAGKAEFLTIRRNSVPAAPPVPESGFTATATGFTSQDAAKPEPEKPVQRASTDLPLDGYLRVDATKATKYRTLKRKWFDAAVAFNGRTVREYVAATAGFEGDYATMLTTFLEDSVLKIEFASPEAVPVNTWVAQQAQQAVSTQVQQELQQAQPKAMRVAMQQTPGGVVSGNPGFAGQAALQGATAQTNVGLSQGFMGQQTAAIPSPLWSPPQQGTVLPGGTSGPKFP